MKGISEEKKRIGLYSENMLKLVPKLKKQLLKLLLVNMKANSVILMGLEMKNNVAVA